MILASPVFAFAASHYYSCADLDFISASCSDDTNGRAVVTLAPGTYAADNYSNLASVVFDFNNGVGYEVTLDYSGSGDAYMYVHSNSGDCTLVNPFSASGTYPSCSTVISSPSGLVLQSSTFVGTLSNICADNDGSMCGSPPPPPPPIINTIFAPTYQIGYASSTCTEVGTSPISYACLASSSVPLGVNYGDWMIVMSLILFCVAFIPVRAAFSLLSK